MRLVRIVLLTFTLLSALLALKQPVSAVPDFQCSDFNETYNSTALVYKFFEFPVVMKAGEVFRLKITRVSGDTSGTDVELSVNGYVHHQGSVPVNYSFTAPADGVYYISSGINSNPHGATLRVSYRCGFSSGGSSSGEPCPNVADSRINDDAGMDCAAPIAIYKGSVDIYGIDPATGHGNLVLSLGDDVVKAAHDPAAGNVLLGSGVVAATGEAVNVYWLTTNEIEVMTDYPDGKPYIVVWPVDHPEKLYHLAW